MVERRIRQCIADRIHERQRRGAVHDRVLSHQPSTRTVEHDQLHGLVYPAIAESIRGTVPQEAGCCQKVSRRRGIKAEHKGSRMNRIDKCRIRWREAAQAHIVGCPQVAICGGQRANGGESIRRRRDDLFDLATDDA